MTPAVLAFVDELGGDIPVLACHQHFLADVGGDLLERPHARLRELFRRFKVRPGLRTLARDLGRKLGEDVDRGRDAVAAWKDQTEADHVIPDGNDGLAVVRALTQWVLDYAAEGDDLGLPFDRPYLDLYDRCSEARRAVDAFVRRPPEDQRVHRMLRRVRDVLDPIVSEVPFAQVARTLRWRASLFDELRDALRLVPKTTGRNPPTRAPAETIPPEQAQAALRDIRKAVETFAADLRQRRPARGPAQGQRQAIDVILKHIQDHGPTLWGHVITLPEQAGGGIRVVDRTNCRLESLNGDIKHGERRRSGRKKLTQDLENLPPGAPLAFNLHDPDYVDLLCGTLERLPGAFAVLDADARTREFDALPIETIPALFDSPSAIETASLPKRDRNLVRAEGLQRRIRAAARSRAPRTNGRHP
jgi:hypothetical protein